MLNPAGNTQQQENYLHDAHGNMLHMPHLGGGLPGPNMNWDYKDQLRQVGKGGGGAAFFVYDASGQRVRKVWEKAPGLTEERIYLGGFEIFRKHAGPIGANTATLERETLHVMDDKQRIALVETRTLDTAGDDQAPQQLIRYQFGNHLGSASLELDDQAWIISYEEYAPYGSSIYQAVRSQTQSAKRYRYTGKERDEESGLYYHGARYYAAWLGKWTACDPKGPAAGINAFQYAVNNPVRFFDPDGQEVVIPNPLTGLRAWFQNLATQVQHSGQHYKGFVHGAQTVVHKAALATGEAYGDVASLPGAQPGQTSPSEMTVPMATVSSTVVEFAGGIPLAPLALPLLPGAIASTPEALSQGAQRWHQAADYPYPLEAKLEATVPFFQAGAMAAGMLAGAMGPKGPLRGAGSTNVNPLNAAEAFPVLGDTFGWQLSPVGGGRGPWKPSPVEVPGQIPTAVAMAAVKPPTSGNRPTVPLAPHNYRGRYNAARHAQGKSRLPDDWDAHHRIPQEYRQHPEFSKFDFDAPENIQGVKGSRADVNIHQDITNLWKEFRDANPKAKRSHIEAFAKSIDKQFQQHWWK
jgi:RHS repeat-associated protein